MFIDQAYTLEILERLLETPSPSGFTDQAVHLIGEELEHMGVPFELTRRGGIRATLKGERDSPDRAVVAHVDTLGAMVSRIKTNGRLQVVPVGHWNGRFAEGARVTIYTDHHQFRGTLLPLKASGHAYGAEVDDQPAGWEHVELRVDAITESLAETEALGIQIGDFVAVDAAPEFNANGYINARHLDDKAGTAVLLAATKAIANSQEILPVDCHPLFTISEEIGSGASSILHQDVSEMVTIDNGVCAPGQNSREFGVTLAMSDMTGPFDYHLTHYLLHLCRERQIPHQRDVFHFYRSDSAAAIEAGNDLRTALIAIGVDASHGYERTHWDALEQTGRLLLAYMRSPAVFARDRQELGPLRDFPTLPIEPERPGYKEPRKLD